MKTNEGITVSKYPTDDDILDIKNKNKILIQASTKTKLNRQNLQNKRY